MQLYEYALDRWLEVRSDAVGACVAFIVGLMALSGSIVSRNSPALICRSDVSMQSPGTTGFLVSTAIEFISRILYVVRAVNQNELAFNSAHRVLEYTALPSEPPATKRGAPPAAWPTDGELDVDDFAVRYDEQAGDVLKGMTFTVKPGSKIGIVGKSGCGKVGIAPCLLLDDLDADCSCLYQTTFGEHAGVERGRRLTQTLSQRSAAVHALQPRRSPDRRPQYSLDEPRRPEISDHHDSAGYVVSSKTDRTRL